MKVLDRYIITTYLVNFVVLCTVFAGLFMVVDLIVDVDEFVAAAKVYADQYGGLLPAFAVVLFDWYGPLLLLMYTNSSGLIVAAAMGFTLAGMQRNRELTAMLAGGVSMYRLAGPILVVGFALNGLCWPIQEYALPPLAYKLSRHKSELKYPQSRDRPIHYAPDEQGNLLSAAKFNPKTGTLHEVTILERNAQGLAVGRITAPTAKWIGGEHASDISRNVPDRHAKTDGGTDNGDGTDTRARVGVGDSDSGKANTPGPRSRWWFSGPGGTEVKPRSEFSVSQAKPIRSFKTGLSPTILAARRATMLPRFLSISELKQMRGNPAVSGSQRDQITKVIWSRFSLTVTNVLILVMGLPFFLLRTPRNMLIQSIKAASLCLGAWGGGLMLLTLSVAAIAPVAGAWLPVVLYLPVAAALITMVQT